MTTTSETLSLTAGQSTYTLSFAYLKESDLKVTIGGVTKALTTDYTLSGSSITFVGAITGSETIVVTRETDTDTAAVSWASATSLDPTDLDTMNLQSLYSVQELKNIVNASESSSLQSQITTNTDNITTVTSTAATAASDASTASSVASTANTTALAADTKADAASAAAGVASSAATVADNKAVLAQNTADANESDITTINTTLTSHNTRVTTLENAGSSSSLQGLSDTNISTPTNNQVLTYDSASSKWTSQAAQGASSSFTGTIDSWRFGRLNGDPDLSTLTASSFSGTTHFQLTNDYMTHQASTISLNNVELPNLWQSSNNNLNTTLTFSNTGTYKIWTDLIYEDVPLNTAEIALGNSGNTFMIVEWYFEQGSSSTSVNKISVGNRHHTELSSSGEFGQFVDVGRGTSTSSEVNIVTVSATTDKLSLWLANNFVTGKGDMTPAYDFSFVAQINIEKIA